MARQAYLEVLAAVIFGLRPKRDAHRRIVIIHGPAGSGKSTLLDILSMFVSPEVTASVPLSSLGKEGSRARLEGKLLNLCPELSSKALHDDEQAANIKKFAAGEKVTGRRLYQDEFEFVCHAIHVNACSELPAGRSNYEAYRRRMLTLKAEHPLGAG